MTTNKAEELLQQLRQHIKATTLSLKEGTKIQMDKNCYFNGIKFSITQIHKSLNVIYVSLIKANSNQSFVKELNELSLEIQCILVDEINTNTTKPSN